MSSPTPALVFVGGGPRTAGLLERLAANAPTLLTGPLAVHVVEPFAPGSGRIWRYEQAASLMLNSTAGDVTMFTDASVSCAGPTVDGPDLAQWAAALTAGTLPDAPTLPPHLVAQAAALTPASFPTRQLNSAYLGWFFRRAVTALAPHATVHVHEAMATEVVRVGERWHVQLAGLAPVVGDAVVLALGHSDAHPDTTAARFAAFAHRHGAFHAAPAYTTDVDYAALTPGRDVIVSGLGLAFVDLMVLLMEGRGGRFTEHDDGTLHYTPSGAEPRVWAGSRRGVPFHSKITATLRGGAPEEPRYLTAAAVAPLLATHPELDFHTQLWPLLAKDVAYTYYRELLAQDPAWPAFAAAFHPLAWGSPALTRLIAATVPDPAQHLDFAALDFPLAGQHFPTVAASSAAVAQHIAQDLRVRDGGEHPETLALFLGLLRAYLDLGQLVPADRLTAAAQTAMQQWWHGFFSFVDSGPPPLRLRQLLALHRAGLLHFLGPGLQVSGDEATGEFVARSGQGDAEVRASAFIEARLPAATVVHSANPVLRSLQATGQGSEQQLLTADGTVSTGKLWVDTALRVLDADGQPTPGLFAVGPGTSAWAAAAFSRPHTNAAPFRDNDALARSLLELIAATTHPTLLERTLS